MDVDALNCCESRSKEMAKICALLAQERVKKARQNQVSPRHAVNCGSRLDTMLSDCGEKEVRRHM